jgi:hypothetical protein
MPRLFSDLICDTDLLTTMGGAEFSSHIHRKARGYHRRIEEGGDNADLQACIELANSSVNGLVDL